jgi:hypothetical protein
MTPESNSKPIAASQPTVITVTLSPVFKLIFLSVLGLTILSLIIGCTIVGLNTGMNRAMAEQDKALFELCASTFKLGFGAIIGMLGGKAL